MFCGSIVAAKQLGISIEPYNHKSGPKAGFIPRTQIYAVYADHFAHVGRVFSATNADLRRSDRRSDRTDADYKHSYNTPNFTLTFARLLKLC